MVSVLTRRMPYDLPPNVGALGGLSQKDTENLTAFSVVAPKVANGNLMRDAPGTGGVQTPLV